MPKQEGVILRPPAFEELRRIVLDHRRGLLGRGPAMPSSHPTAPSDRFLAFITGNQLASTIYEHSWQEAHWKTATKRIEIADVSWLRDSAISNNTFARPAYHAAAPTVPLPDDTLVEITIAQADDHQTVIYLARRLDIGEPMQVILQTSPTELIADQKWLYTGVEAVRENSANRPWIEVSGGIEIQCYNDHEDLLASEYETYEGSDPCEEGTEAPEITLKRLPHHAGTPVRVFLSTSEDGVPIWSFDKPNPVQVCCGTPA